MPEGSSVFAGFLFRSSVRDITWYGSQQVCSSEKVAALHVFYERLRQRLSMAEYRLRLLAPATSTLRRTSTSGRHRHQVAGSSPEHGRRPHTPPPPPLPAPAKAPAKVKKAERFTEDVRKVEAPSVEADGPKAELIKFEQCKPAEVPDRKEQHDHSQVYHEGDQHDLCQHRHCVVQSGSSVELRAPCQ